jgi:hypothetical protein
MGTWGAALYDDDNASDLKETIALVCRVPVSGDTLLAILKDLHGDCDPADEEGALFWLVTADQFERRGIECAEAASTAVSIIAAGHDLAHAKAKGADEAFLKKRSGVLQELARRLKSPRKFRPRVTPRQAPSMVVSTGEIYSFRTMKGCAWHPYWLTSLYGAFEPDGWGALVVLATGRAFEWLPWVAVASLTVKGNRKPTLEEALRAHLIFHSQTMGAGRFSPKPKEVRGLGLELLGRVKLDPRRVKPHLSKWSISTAIEYGWPMSYGAIGPRSKRSPKGPKLRSLIKA